MLKKAIGAFDTSTGKFVAAPKVDYREMIKFQLGSEIPESHSSCASRNATPISSSGYAAFASSSGAAPSSKGGHLHYGGSVNQSKKSMGVKPQSGRTFKQQKRLELIVRMENAAIPEGQIAAMLLITVNRLRSIRKTLEYLKARHQITLGIVVEAEASLPQIKEQRKEVLTQMLPQALQVIANVIYQPTALLDTGAKKLQVSVAQDLMDREGTLAKVSKSEIKVEDKKFDWNFMDQSHGSVLDVIRGSAQSRMNRNAFDLQNTINLSQDFSNSATISAIDQQASLDNLEKQALAEALASGRQDA